MPKNKHCACSGGNLDRMVRPAILVCLAKSELHGYQLLKELQEMVMFESMPPDLTGIYRCLRDMESEGLLISEWDTPDEGRAKRRFRITSDGYDCLVRWGRTLENYSAAVTDLRKRVDKTLKNGTKMK
jgi:DNA-binding PadR family transcriptional regulator